MYAVVACCRVTSIAENTIGNYDHSCLLCNATSFNFYTDFCNTQGKGKGQGAAITKRTDCHNNQGNLLYLCALWRYVQLKLIKIFWPSIRFGVVWEDDQICFTPSLSAATCKQTSGLTFVSFLGTQQLSLQLGAPRKKPMVGCVYKNGPSQKKNWKSLVIIFRKLVEL